MINPIQFRKILVNLLKILIAVELLGALIQGVHGDGWVRLGFDCVIAGVLYIAWDRIKSVLQVKKDEYRRRVQSNTQQTRLWDAMAFSLLWSDEIYSDVPADRKRIILISYTLIAIGLAALYLKIGSGLMPLVIAGGLVLAAINLLVWTVSLERGEKESLQTELKLAHDVQTSLMPKEHPAIEGYEIFGRSIPAREVGGDHFDYAVTNNNGCALCISIFDVSGKGMQAAMSAVYTSGAYASEVRQSNSPAEILTHLNRSIYVHSKRGHFVAFLLAAFSRDERCMTFANAGQIKPLLLTSGETQWLNSKGVSFPLGMVDDSAYEECAVPLHRGDALFFLTDGVTEAMNGEKELFGEERLEDVIRRLDPSSQACKAMLEEIVGEVRTHVGSASQHDDLTMVVVKVL